MIVATMVIALIVAIILVSAGVIFMAVGAVSSAAVGYGKALSNTGKVFLWSGLVMFAFLILTMVLDISGIYY